MTDPAIFTTATIACLSAFVIAAAALLRGWRDWLELKRLELANRQEPARPLPSSPAARIELADLRERVRRLEAIANGIES